MWRRLRRRSMAPSRPAVFPEQWPLAVLSVLAILGGLVAVAWVLFS